MCVFQENQQVLYCSLTNNQNYWIWFIQANVLQCNVIIIIGITPVSNNQKGCRNFVFPILVLQTLQQSAGCYLPAASIFSMDCNKSNKRSSTNYSARKSIFTNTSVQHYESLVYTMCTTLLSRMHTDWGIQHNYWASLQKGFTFLNFASMRKLIGVEGLNKYNVHCSKWCHTYLVDFRLPLLLLY